MPKGSCPGVGCDRTTYALGGEMDNAGGCLKWFLENLITQADHDAAAAEGLSIFQYMDKLAAEVPPGSEGLLFLPWIWGERSPVNDENVRGGIYQPGIEPYPGAHAARRPGGHRLSVALDLQQDRSGWRPADRGACDRRRRD